MDLIEVRERSRCRCGHTHGYLVHRNGQDTIRCAGCDTYLYCQPRTESGREQRSVRSRPTIKPSQRARLLDAYGHACVACNTDDKILHIGHLIPVDAWERFGTTAGMTHDELYADENLVPLCEECNLGMGNTLASIRLILKAQRMRRVLAEDVDDRF